MIYQKDKCCRIPELQYSPARQKMICAQCGENFDIIATHADDIHIKWIIENQ